MCGVMAADPFCTMKLASQSARLDSDALNPLETLTGSDEDLIYSDFSRLNLSIDLNGHEL